MAEFTEVIKQRDRLCDCYKTCRGCQIYEILCFSTCKEWIMEHPKEAEEIIMAWAKEHPIQTNAYKFKEVFGIDVRGSRCPMVQTSECRKHGICNDSCKYYNFWNEEYKAPMKDEE